jgi:hypothetical protein
VHGDGTLSIAMRGFFLRHTNVSLSVSFDPVMRQLPTPTLYFALPQESGGARTQLDLVS